MLFLYLVRIGKTLLSMQNLTNLVVVTFWSWLIAVTWSFSFQGSLLFPRGFSVFKMVSVSASQGEGEGEGVWGVVLNQYLGISEPLRVWHLTELREKKPLYMPCLGQHPQVYYILFRTKDTMQVVLLKPFIGNCNYTNSLKSYCFCILGARTNFVKQIQEPE